MQCNAGPAMICRVAGEELCGGGMRERRLSYGSNTKHIPAFMNTRHIYTAGQWYSMFHVAQDGRTAATSQHWTESLSSLNQVYMM